ncbi:hypothetical protein XENTR_v10000330 [Xenopus tropicalis]|nr:hypothetical protein XENTR_v10000330 [Xenopus tropicalis]
MRMHIRNLEHSTKAWKLFDFVSPLKERSHQKMWMWETKLPCCDSKRCTAFIGFLKLFLLLHPFVVLITLYAVLWISMALNIFMDFL